MRSLRLWVGAFVALAFAATSAVAAPEKKFTIDVSPANVAALQKYTVVIKNQTPNGNSSINSLKVVLPTDYKVESSDAGTSPPSANWGGNVSGPDGAGVITMSNMAPLKPQDFFTLTFWAKASATATACSDSSWTAQAWTGSSFSGDTFRQVVAPELSVNTTTKLNGTPSVTIGTLPSNPVVGVGFTFGVSVSNGCGPASSTAVSIVGTPALATGSGCTTTNATGNSTCSVTINSVGPASVTVSALSASDTEALTIWGGTLACEGGGDYQFPPAADDPVVPGDAAGKRGGANKDGSPCQAVGYTFDNTILDNNTVSFAWNTGNGQQGAAFEYTMIWKPEYVNATTGMPERVTSVKWAGLGSAVPGRACLSASLPKDYGTLGAAIGAGDGSITIVAGSTAAPAAPFPIVIGNERLLVTDTSGGSTWLVQRGNGGTTASGHAGGAKVMSTPLPLDGSGNVMQICIVSEGWVSAPAGGSDTDCVVPDPAPGSNGPRACVVFKTTVFDLGDGLIIRGGS